MTYNTPLNPGKRAKYALAERNTKQVANRCVCNGIIAPRFKQYSQNTHLKVFEGYRANFCRKYDPKYASFDLGHGLYSGCNSAHSGIQAVKAYEPPVYPLLEKMKIHVKEALQILGLNTPKYLLLFKIHVAKPLNMAELTTYAPKVRKNHLSRFHKLFDMPYALRNKYDNLAFILPLLRKVEGQDYTVETAHRLISYKLEKLRTWLNCNTDYNFDAEAVNNLLFVVL